MNLFLPRKRHLVTAVPAVVYAVNYLIIIQVISEIQEKSCAFVEMVEIVCCHCFFNKERAIDDIDVEYLNTFWHNSIQTAITVLCLFLNIYLMRF